MDILIITPIFPFSENQQSGIYVKEQSIALSKLGHRTVILHANALNYKKWKLANFFKHEMENHEEYTVHRINYPALLSTRLPRVNQFSYNYFSKKLITKITHGGFKPQLIISHFSFPSGFFAVKIAKKFKSAKLITIEHYSFFLKEKISRYFTKMLEVTVNKSDMFIAVSNKLKNSLENLVDVKKEIKVLNNMVSPLFRYSEKKEYKNFTFFSAGNLVSIKRFDLLIDAFTDAFKKDDKTVKLIIAGSGKLENQLKRKVLDLERTHQIILKGRLNRLDIYKEYQDSNCFVLASDKETFGIVYREALLVGRPVISTRNGGIEENWDDSFGILVPIGDKNKLSEALIEIYKNKDRYDNKKISELASKYFSEETYLKKMESIINEILI